jgi:hypothetical protein
LFEQVPEGAEVEAKVMVHRGGKLDIRMRVEGPYGKAQYNALLFSNLDASGAMLSTIVKKGTTFIAPTTGVYSFCLDNKMAKYTAKAMVFDLNVRDPNSSASKMARAAEAATKATRTGQETAQESVEFMRMAAQRLMGKLVQIVDAQLYHYHRERRHRNTIESTNDRVAWWNGTESLVVMAVAAFQIMLIRRWFKTSYSLPSAWSV